MKRIAVLLYFALSACAVDEYPNPTDAGIDAACVAYNDSQYRAPSLDSQCGADAPIAERCSGAPCFVDDACAPMPGAIEQGPGDAGSYVGAWCCPVPCPGNYPLPNICMNAPQGTICEGFANQGIHGECDGKGSCEITEWTCLRNPEGTACQGGFCDSQQECCSGGCLSVDGVCVYGAGHIGGMCAPPM